MCSSSKLYFQPLSLGSRYRSECDSADNLVFVYGVRLVALEPLWPMVASVESVS
jgi:hypothetical protein